MPVVTPMVLLYYHRMVHPQVMYSQGRARGEAEAEAEERIESTRIDSLEEIRRQRESVANVGNSDMERPATPTFVSNTPSHRTVMPAEVIQQRRRSWSHGRFAGDYIYDNTWRQEPVRQPPGVRWADENGAEERIEPQSNQYGPYTPFFAHGGIAEVSTPTSARPPSRPDIGGPYIPDSPYSPLRSPHTSGTGRLSSRDPRAWQLETYSYVIPVTFKRILAKQIKRGPLTMENISDILHDLLAASFVPLTDHRTDPEEIQDQAAEFLSSFSENNAVWKVDVGTLPFRQGQLIMGMTPGARDEAVGRRFLRFRFPLVRFEWQVETPHAALRTNWKEAVEIKLMWKAWSRGYASAALVAYGFCVDSLALTEGNFPVIKKRLFQVTNILQPELMTPVPYPDNVPPLSAQNDFMVFSTSQTMIQMLQASKERMALLVALSAFVTSLYPIVNRYSHAAGWLLTGIGIVSAAISILSVFAGWMLKWIDTHAARHRQVRGGD